jgi:phosphate transport system ATP-binding protein
VTDPGRATNGGAANGDANGRETFVSVEGLSVHYGTTAALRDVALRVARGRITAIVGPSGCGKSTFLAVLNRLTDLVESARVEGRVHVGGQDVRDPRCDVVALRRRVGMIFQKPNPFPLSIRRNLALPLREHGVPRAEVPARIERALRDVGLWSEVSDRLDAPAQALSGGQQQRLCLARALALEPEALLLDEPCSALDPLSAGIVEDHIATLRERYTVILVTHDLGQARRLADDAAFFWHEDGAGRLIESGSARRVLEDPREERTRHYVRGTRG